MKKLFTEQEFELAKQNTKLPLECKTCKNTFYRDKRTIRQVSMKENRKNACTFCSYKCRSKNFSEIVSCANCGQKFEKLSKEIKKSKSGNHFCSKSCSTVYNNKHKKHGTRRSKFEAWVEKQLKKQFPELGILFNDKSIIGSELDIYIPSLKLAFEINGIYHYKPIYGVKKLLAIQKNDQEKLNNCLNLNIHLVILDISKINQFNIPEADKYLQIITSKVNDLLSNV
jgi:ribosomal protein L37AE/L43A